MRLHTRLDHPFPLPVDPVRDGWDWLSLWVGLGSAVIGLFVGITAIVLARKANRHAKEAMEMAAEAERRAIERATDERRRLFELEILRDMLEQCNPHDNKMRSLAREFGREWMDVEFGAQLMMLPDDELPFWRAYPTFSREARYRMMPHESAEQAIEQARYAGTGGQLLWQADAEFTEVMTREFRQDLKAAITRRMR
ncbi:hypothetical protein HDA40_003441 [Hamadaea flava]|uniref:Uncharacterized protein n=1 Tax=Hamadaea flava TaxID=1742688 RepID=A0ABV8LKA2_9ACTN|nr:hypothetical protein [Hamadaea flava]MCP2324934.1 hypothetical protein [Hamadaea flava]